MGNARIMNRAGGFTALFGQVARFAITGGFVTALGIAIYLFFATIVEVPPLVANLISYAVCVTIGYFLHSRWSFRGHGRRDNAAKTTSRFLMVSLASLSLNSLFVWILTGPMGGPDWWPTVPMVFVTPLVTFALNRRWVFN